ncbi:MAG TPA: asparagine synthase-related protein, partial [Acidimicrobiales bacterium]|nr:asparagine synthase-related protein [Acidimicrobiales bacterium]
MPYQLDAFETATGYVGGTDPDVPPLAKDAHEGKSPLEALEAAVLPALSRPPCLVVFSGGRDSSAVLAVATAVARRSGLPDPVPATNRFRGSPAAEETEWQELVVRHLGLTDWHVLDWDDELDVIGPVAQQVLSRWGPVYPHNAHFGIPLLRAARGGSALTGVGGDQIFVVGQTLRLARLLTFKQRPRLRDWRTLAGAVTPRSIRQHRWQKGLTALPWLTETANRRFSETLTRDMAIDPIWFASTVRGPVWRERSRVATEQTLGALCRDIDVSMGHPLEDPGFLAALASALPRTGYRT